MAKESGKGAREIPGRWSQRKRDIARMLTIANERGLAGG